MEHQPLISIVTSFYNGGLYITGFLENLSSQTIASHSELILIINDPSILDIATIKKNIKDFSGKYKLLNISPVEPLGKSWNRGCRAAQGEFICLWNVDDRRPNDALERQINSLIENDDCMISYGDFVWVNEVGQINGNRYVTHTFSKKYFSNGWQTGGAFLVFRKELLERINYFDEQFKSAADFDFEQRAVITGHGMVKTEGIVGYFTNSGMGLSTNLGSNISPAEQIAVRLRYGIYHRAKWEYIAEAKKYTLDQYLIDDQWVKIESIIPFYRKYINKRKYLWLVGWFRNLFRISLTKIGLLKYIYRLRDAIVNARYTHT